MKALVSNMLNILALFVLLTSSALFASDFLFEVPVKLDRIPKGIPQAKIQCDVFGYRDNKEPIASGYSIRPIGTHRGELIDTVRVSVNYQSMKRHINPHMYQCRLLLLTPWAESAWQMPATDSVDTSIHPLPDSKPVTLVEGILSTR